MKPVTIKGSLSKYDVTVALNSIAEAWDKLAWQKLVVLYWKELFFKCKYSDISRKLYAEQYTLAQRMEMSIKLFIRHNSGGNYITQIAK